MLKDVGTMVLMDTFLTLSLSVSLVKTWEPTYACSERLFWVGSGFLIYFAWFTLRNLMIMAVCYFAKKPEESALMCRLSCACIDWIVFSLFVLRATFILFSEEIDICRQHDN
jgi:arginine exporter protein ArgO